MSGELARRIRRIRARQALNMPRYGIEGDRPDIVGRYLALRGGASRPAWWRRPEPGGTWTTAVDLPRRGA